MLALMTVTDSRLSHLLLSHLYGNRQSFPSNWTRILPGLNHTAEASSLPRHILWSSILRWLSRVLSIGIAVT
jgi:hypothetical protein